MKERPILFSTAMIQAILEGRKTMTRRKVKPQFDDDEYLQLGYYCPAKVDSHGELYPGNECYGLSNEHFSIKCPYGVPGDQLWVKETFTYDLFNRKVYRATHGDFDGVGKRFTWTPSIFMPRKVSRITLLIKSIRVERLQDISEDDAQNEGADMIGGIDKHFTYKHGFYQIWKSINGIDSWEKNPWVWVILFERIKP